MPWIIFQELIGYSIKFKDIWASSVLQEVAKKICLIVNESNVIDPGFLKRMDTLLAEARVPSPFEGSEHTSLLAACKEGA
ncbi:hypothetical protein MJO28_006171 [Puccinia striiformis f. sp. tritici]|uniref:Uncharacterized protein n=1 Tax=Puccinia striiformis f. sp. tritici TaxID=168172 RepID=A0ACC0EGN7_9BASI|nr:hypothetical protein MJO28_006171 [Puccinia striiformis f. sp. tritici]